MVTRFKCDSFEDLRFKVSEARVINSFYFSRRLSVEFVT